MMVNLVLLNVFELVPYCCRCSRGGTKTYQKYSYHDTSWEICISNTTWVFVQNANAGL